MRRWSIAFGFAGVLALGGSALLGECLGSAAESGSLSVAVAQAAPGPAALRPAKVVLSADWKRRQERERTAERAARRRLLGLDVAELDTLVQADPSAIGSLSLGKANRGGLFNGVELPESPLWRRVEPDKAFGTQETIDGISHAIHAVHRTFADTHELWVGHISRQRGGWLRPHRSHQSGRDVDLGFYYTDDSRWYVRGSEKNLDVARNWVLLKTLLVETDVEFVFLDRSVQRLMIEYAKATGEDAAWLEATFEGDRRDAQCIVRHVWGHATHMHVRFRSEVSRHMAERAYPALARAGHLPRGAWYKAR